MDAINQSRLLWRTPGLTVLSLLTDQSTSNSLNLFQENLPKRNSQNISYSKTWRPLIRTSIIVLICWTLTFRQYCSDEWFRGRFVYGLHSVKSEFRLSVHDSSVLQYTHSIFYQLLIPLTSAWLSLSPCHPYSIKKPSPKYVPLLQCNHSTSILLRCQR